MALVTSRRVRALPLPADTTVALLDAARHGDAAARDELFERILPALRRWAHGRLPPWARGAAGTEDIVQDAVLAALRHLDGFEPHHQGALQAYLRQAVMNRIRDVIRRQRTRVAVELPDDVADHRPSPLDAAIGAENVERYERALARLSADDRDVIIGRLELQYSYDELAVAVSRPSPDAARMAVTRAIKRLIAEMSHE